MPIVIGPDLQYTETEETDLVGDRVLDWDNDQVWDGEQTWDGYFGSGDFDDLQSTETEYDDLSQNALGWSNPNAWNGTQTWTGLKTQ